MENGGARFLAENMFELSRWTTCRYVKTTNVTRVINVLNLIYAKSIIITLMTVVIVVQPDECYSITIENVGPV